MIIGYNFLSDEDSLDPMYLNVGKINKIKLMNAVFDELNLMKGIQDNSSAKTGWNYYNLLLAKFQGNLNAGNVDFTGMSVATLKIKRRKKEELNNWYTLFQENYVKDKQYEFYDNLNTYGQEYEYAIVPTTASNIEGNYVNDSVISEFDSAFICEKYTSYKLKYNMTYGDTTRVKPVGVFEPIGSKYPITIRNGQINYEKGDLTALVLSEQTENLGTGIDRVNEVSHRKALLDFLTNGNAKVLKDFNGNVWMIQISDNPQVSYLNDLSQGLANIKLTWVETGDMSSKDDLYANNFIERAD